LQNSHESDFVDSDFCMSLALITGIIIGFSVAAPVGPIALLIMRRSLNEGRLSGFVSGLGAATADLVCGLAAALGLSALTLIVNSHRTSLQLVGGIFMLWLGVHAFRAKDPATAAQRPLHERSLVLAYLFTFLLTMSNPLTLLGMVGVVAAAGVGGPAYSHADTIVLGGGIFLGSASWWLLLSNLTGWLGRKLGNHALHVINMIAGALISGFGLWQLVSLLFRWLHRV
jgi:threonine/homoserine/homoserine lactone efflux protein